MNVSNVSHWSSECSVQNYISVSVNKWERMWKGTNGTNIHQNQSKQRILVRFITSVGETQSLGALYVNGAFFQSRILKCEDLLIEVQHIWIVWRW
jgi:hypothetical protein